MDFFQKPEFWLVILTALSEIIGMSKMKQNSIAQVVLSLAQDGIRKKQGKGKRQRKQDQQSLQD